MPLDEHLLRYESLEQIADDAPPIRGWDFSRMRAPRGPVRARGSGG
jgi:hypothetical protein